MIGRAGGIERDYQPSLRPDGALERSPRRDRQAADLDRPRLAEGPEQGASAQLPLPAELFGLCDHRFDAMAPRGMACTEANLRCHPWGGQGPTRFPDFQGRQM